MNKSLLFEQKLDNQSINKKELRRILDLCLANNASFTIKRLSNRGCQLTILSPTMFESKQYSLANSASNSFFNCVGSKTIAVVGPDGSGKTTLIDTIKASDYRSKLRFKRFKRYFRRVLPHIVRSQDRNEREQKLLWLILPVAWLTFIIGFILSVKGKTTLLDRYFYDYLFRYERETEQPLEKIANYSYWTKFLPRPAGLIIVICPAQEIRKRKKEMSVDAINALYDVYIDQVIDGSLANVLFCNTNLRPDVSCQQAVNFLNTIK